MVEAEQGVNNGIGTFLTFGAKSVDPQILEQLLIGRKEVVGLLFNNINQIVESGSNTNIILIGKRGSGKTHILRVLFHRIQPFVQDRELVVAYFAEEEYGIDSYLDFLVRIINAFKRWYDDDAVFLEGELEKIRETPASRQEDLAELVIVDYIKDKPLLILTENFDATLSAIQKAGQDKLRAFLFRHNRISFIATSQSLIPDLRVEDKPFYNYFLPIELKTLSYKESVALLKQLASVEDRRDLLKHLESKGRSQVRAIHELVKGNHRLLVTFYEFLKADSLAELSTIFIKTMNDLKPYFETFVRYLPPQQQKIIHYLALCKVPKRGTDIGKNCFISDKSISKQLSELQRRRLIEGIPDPASKRDKLYDISEPLLRIAIEVGEQKQGITSLFIDFLALYYSHDELYEQRGKFENLYMQERVPLLKEKYRFEIEAREKALRIKMQYFTDTDTPTLEQAKTLFDKKDFMGVIALLENVKGKDVKVLVNLGKSYLMIDDFKTALTCLTEAFKLAPDFNQSLSIPIGFCYAKVKDHSLAVQWLEKAVTENPRSTLAWIHLGISYSELQEYEKSIQCLQRSIELDRTNIKSWSELGVAYLLSDQNENAVAAFQEANKLDPNDEFVTYCLALSYFENEQHENSISMYMKLSDWKKDNDVLLDIAHSYYYLKELNVSIDYAQIALKKDRKNLEALRLLGALYSELNDYVKSRKYYLKVLEIEPENFWAVLNLGISHMSLEKYDDAKVCFYRAAEINSSDKHPWLNLGSMYQYLEQYDDAIACYNEVLKRQPDDTDALFNLGFIYALTNNLEAARSIFTGLIPTNIKDAMQGILIFLDEDLPFMKALYSQHAALSGASAYDAISEIVTSYLKEDDVELARIIYLQKIIKDVFGSPDKLTFAYKFLEVYKEYVYDKDEHAIYKLPREQREFFVREILKRRDRIEGTSLKP
ncbi:tetratricopeptide repeat protein [Fulvivirgaceae bacterium PWU4]|uniref:Tetratricopeptide repeat protein n=1 Tax=Chryseosolibacter histidini TaxID=2782349 RepID=A0AAP2DSG5_9BACT|nr:ATP-binding protein [Chryseosolibacter histidini]MBT1700367.1 tetratricopeptide repeat protein [Chryseosolibacter histidini]